MYEFGTIKIAAAVFQSPFNPDHFYVAFEKERDYPGVRQAMDHYREDLKHDYKAATAVMFDETEGRFFMVYVQDCMDPPIAIVRATHAGEAQEIFADELKWAHVEEPDLADYSEDSLQYNSHGEPYDSEQIYIQEVKLVRLDVQLLSNH